MKKVISIMISALAVCAISCQKDDMAPELGRKTINMHIFASHDGTKTALIEEDEKLVR